MDKTEGGIPFLLSAGEGRELHTFYAITGRQSPVRQRGETKININFTLILFYHTWHSIGKRYLLAKFDLILKLAYISIRQTL